MPGGHAYADTASLALAYRHTDSLAHRHTDSLAYWHADSPAYSYAQSDAEATPNAASSPLRNFAGGRQFLREVISEV